MDITLKTEDLFTTIGLEIHVELNTVSKMFCGCAVGFGGEPNTRVCPVCLGHPGTLPVPNGKAIEFATKISMALGCEIAPRSIFHRKNYFYPDMPKNYQISQYDIPIGSGGFLDVDLDGVVHRVGITRVHLEEDTGKSLHIGGGGRIHDAEYSLEDFNRAGTPLVEIVTEPDITSAEVARAFAQELRLILEFLGVSDVQMQEGSLRIDANISVAREGERGTKAEVKNMNSMRSVLRALLYEEQRQREVLQGDGVLEQSTRHWDEKAGVTQPLRTKEFAFDYRYFPEPDLVPIEPSVEWLRQLTEEIPEVPAERRKRLVAEMNLTAYDAGVVSSSRAIADFYDAAVGAARSSTPKQVANWMSNQLAGLLSEAKQSLAEAKISPRSFAALVDAVSGGDLSRVHGNEVLIEMLATGHESDAIIKDKGFGETTDRGAVESVVDDVLSANPDVVARLKSGDSKPMGFLVGLIMKATRGQANPITVREILDLRLKD
ncbi:MAG: Asp-tRNA(Asn)/Glu-tRNA(Gln) amidotransferase subunit GatB [Actinomycetota bacterium]